MLYVHELISSYDNPTEVDTIIIIIDEKIKGWRHTESFAPDPTILRG